MNGEEGSTTMNNNSSSNSNNNNNSTSNASSSTTTRTILRIKRRRTDEPLPYIRLEGLDGTTKRRRDSTNGEDLVDTSVTGSSSTTVNNHASSSNSNHSGLLLGSGGGGGANRSTTALWKRFELPQADESGYRIVNAMLSSEDDNCNYNFNNNNNNTDGSTRQTKRRKLTVLETTTSDLPSVVSLPKQQPHNRQQPIRVLDPLTRLVDDSLQEVHAGNKRVADHYRFIMSDSRVAHESKKWLLWCHSEGGNILHACALWNDVDTASELLHFLSPAEQLTEALDADGRTPYEVAQLSGHSSICEILEAFGGDTSNFVYDIFCLDDDQDAVKKEDYYYYSSGGAGGDGGTFSSSGILLEDQPMTVELTSGVGYWTPDGELVLEAPEKSPASLNHVFDEDGEIDSNCEEYGGNDYPEDEDWGDDFFLTASTSSYHHHHHHRQHQQHQPQHNTIDMYREEADYNDLVHSGYE